MLDCDREDPGRTPVVGASCARHDEVMSLYAPDARGVQPESETPMALTLHLPHRPAVASSWKRWREERRQMRLLKRGMRDFLRGR